MRIITATFDRRKRILWLFPRIRLTKDLQRKILDAKEKRNLFGTNAHEYERMQNLIGE